VSELVLKLRQPAQVGDRSREDFVLSTMKYLPGSVVRGAFAAAWLARNGVSGKGTSQRQEFLRIFEGGVRFGALLPRGAEDPSLSVVSRSRAGSRPPR
jgi:CRISPR-associated protein Csx10